MERTFIGKHGRKVSCNCGMCRKCYRRNWAVADRASKAHLKPPSKLKYFKVGDIFGRLTITALLPVKHAKKRYCVCACSCGKTSIVSGGELRQSKTKSCGCLHSESARERFRKHGMQSSPEYGAWQNLKDRCLNPQCKSYKDYGGRGITVCQRWQDSFENFYSDVGPRPSRMYSIDRWPNNNGNYEPGNVRWATAAQQSRNQRSNRYLNISGKRMVFTDAANYLGISKSVLYARIKAGFLR